MQTHSHHPAFWVRCTTAAIAVGALVGCTANNDVAGSGTTTHTAQPNTAQPDITRPTPGTAAAAGVPSQLATLFESMPASISVADATPADTSTATALTHSGPVAPHRTARPVTMFDDGSVLWEDSPTEQNQDLINTNLALHSADGKVTTLRTGNTEGTQRQVVSNATGSNIVAWRSTTSMGLDDEDWLIEASIDGKPAIELANMNTIDTREGLRSVPLDTDASMAIVGRNVVWHVAAPQEINPETGEVTPATSGSEWWVANVDTPGAATKYAVNAAYPQTVGNTVVGVRGLETSTAEIVEFNPTTGDVAPVTSVTLQPDELVASFCAGPDYFAVSTAFTINPDLITEMDNANVDYGGIGRVVIFDRNNTLHSVALNFGAPYLTCGTSMIGLGEEGAQNGAQYYFDWAGTPALRALGKHPNFGVVEVAGRNIRWSTPDPNTPDAAHYNILRNH